MTLGTGDVDKVTYPAIFVVLIAAALWCVLKGAPLGRRVYATGANAEPARLAGVRASTVMVGTLVACGAEAAHTGFLVAATRGNADPVIAPQYLLLALTAAFLGPAQFRGGSFTVLGAVVAAYVLAAGVKGLQLAGTPVWIPNVFDGAGPLVAVAQAKHQADAGRGGARASLRRLDRRGGATAHAQTS